MIIRDAGPQDRAQWQALWQGFLDHYAMVLPPEVIDFTWTRLMDPACPMQAPLAYDGTQALGFAIHQHHPSTWVMGDDCYLEDLFVAPTARGQGVGRALIEDLMQLARAKSYKRLYWNTESDNLTARRLYDRFTPSDGYTRYRLTL
jgi:GNAT superfamily N-acetyltransferase